MRSVLSKLFLATLTVGLISAMVVAPASAEHVQCGETITQSTTLDSDIIDCTAQPAIAIIGTGITLDLAGHTVDGTGGGDGISTFQLGFHSADITVRNGLVREFKTGVDLDDGSDQAARDLTVTDNETGVSISIVRRAVVEGVTATRNSTGIRMNDLIDPVVENNDVFANAAGIGGHLIRNGTVARNRVHDNEFDGVGWSSFWQGRILDNRITGNGLNGLWLDDSSFGNVLESNDVEGNGADGILITPGGEQNTLVGNRTDRNGDDGIDIDWHSSTLTRNSASFNGDFGIEAVPGTIDGGKNKARQNGNPAQCVGVSCK
jgi:parallel beta-helix repeat protein